MALAHLFLVVLLVAILRLGGAQILCPTPCHCTWEILNCSRRTSSPRLFHVPLPDPTGPPNDFYYLDFTGNAISLIGKEVWKDYTWAKYLILKGNRLTIVRKMSLEGLPSLTYLDLSGNRIRTITRNAFELVPSLQFINLSGNIIEWIPDGMFQAWHGMPFPTTLDLGATGITPGILEDLRQTSLQRRTFPQQGVQISTQEGLNWNQRLLFPARDRRPETSAAEFDGLESRWTLEHAFGKKLLLVVFVPCTILFVLVELLFLTEMKNESTGNTFEHVQSVLPIPIKKLQAACAHHSTAKHGCQTRASLCRKKNPLPDEEHSITGFLWGDKPLNVQYQPLDTLLAMADEEQDEVFVEEEEEVHNWDNARLCLLEPTEGTIGSREFCLIPGISIDGVGGDVQAASRETRPTEAAEQACAPAEGASTGNLRTEYIQV